MSDLAAYADTTEELALGEDELQAFCGRLLAGASEPEDDVTLADLTLRAEVTERLSRCGVRLVLRAGQAPLCVIPASEDMPELPMACLALCALVLAESGTGRAARAKVRVRDIWERVGQRHGYSEAYVRRAGLGPLEARGLVKVVRPDQRASDAYVVAGPAMAAVDRDLIVARLRALRGEDR